MNLGFETTNLVPLRVSNCGTCRIQWFCSLTKNRENNADEGRVITDIKMKKKTKASKQFQD